jgi:hypothetical protein
MSVSLSGPTQANFETNPAWEASLKVDLANAAGVEEDRVTIVGLKYAAQDDTVVITADYRVVFPSATAGDVGIAALENPTLDNVQNNDIATTVTIEGSDLSVAGSISLSGVTTADVDVGGTAFVDQGFQSSLENALAVAAGTPFDRVTVTKVAVVEVATESPPTVNVEYTVSFASDGSGDVLQKADAGVTALGDPDLDLGDTVAQVGYVSSEISIGVELCWSVTVVGVLSLSGLAAGDFDNHSGLGNALKTALAETAGVSESRVTITAIGAPKGSNRRELTATVTIKYTIVFDAGAAAAETGAAALQTPNLSSFYEQATLLSLNGVAHEGTEILSSAEVAPTLSPTVSPTPATTFPTAVPTAGPTATPTSAPTAAPTATPTAAPTAACPRGQHHVDDGASCQPCDVGTYQDQTGQRSCVMCTEGHYQELTGQNTCTPCAVGSFQALSGQAQCEPCAIGTKNDLAGRGTCDPCPVGHYQPLEGQTFCDRCAPGYFQNEEGEYFCRTCTAGSFCAGQGTADPTPCTAGQYCPERSKSSEVCPLGHFCETSDSKVACNAGVDFCPEGSAIRGSCAAGHVCSLQFTCADGTQSDVWFETAQPAGESGSSDDVGALLANLPDCATPTPALHAEIQSGEIVSLSWDSFDCSALTSTFDGSFLGEHTTRSYAYAVTMGGAETSFSATMEGTLESTRFSSLFSVPYGESVEFSLEMNVFLTSKGTDLCVIKSTALNTVPLFMPDNPPEISSVTTSLTGTSASVEWVVAGSEGD